MKIVITGPKSSGKSTVGERVAKSLNIPFFETDALIEEAYKREHNASLSFYDIYKTVGEQKFRDYEFQAVSEAAGLDWCVLSTGGATFLNPRSRRLLRENAVVVVLKAEIDVLWGRIKQDGKSKYLQGKSPQQEFQKHTELVLEVLEPFADIAVDISDDDAGGAVIERLTEYFATIVKSPNTLGELIRLTTFGESHGAAIGAVLDGVPPGRAISEQDVQAELNRRRPGQSSVSTPRNEADAVKILSGVFEGKTTGAPIAMLIENSDQDSSKYEEIRDIFRPGHADFSFIKKYGLRDHRGGGRSSGRETAGRVAGGAIAKSILRDYGVKITAYSLEIAGIRAEKFDYGVIETNTVRCPDADAAEKMQQAIIDARKEGDSVGGIVEIVVEGVPAGLGDPVFGKLDARLAAAFCSLGAVKGLEFGDGFACAGLKASEFNDPMKGGNFLTNHAGGILGGISTGQNIIARMAVKPTPSISKKQQTCDLNGNNKEVCIYGRHDPCIVPRIIPVVEAMAALVILDAWEIQDRLRPNWNGAV